MTVQFALLGAGRIGKVHAKAIFSNPNACIAAVNDAMEESATLISESYSCPVKSIADIESDPNIDAVVICTPTDTHADLIEKFALANKAVFCEKPIHLEIQRVRGCLEIVKKSETPLMVGFNRRFDPHFSAVKDAVTAGKIGEVEMVQITSRDPGAPPTQYIKSSGGIFRDMTIHDFDMARFLLNEEPVSIYATGSVLTDPEIGKFGDFDSVSVILETESGKQCAISNSRRASYGYDQRIEVHGSKGAVSAENQRPVSIEVATDEGFARPKLHHFFMSRYEEAYAAEIASFIDCIEQGTNPTPSGNDGLMALVLAEAAVKSVTEKRQVKLEEIQQWHPNLPNLYFG